MKTSMKSTMPAALALSSQQSSNGQDGRVVMTGVNTAGPRSEGRREPWPPAWH
jgi:hypothetical protein